MLFMTFFFILLFVLLSVAFFTLLERKSLGYMHIRMGPNKVGPLGLLQPIGDAIKLFLKEENFIFFGNKKMFFFSPFWSISLMCLSWICYPYLSSVFFFNYMFLFLFSLFSLSVYFLMLSGYSSMSKYSLLGSYRSSAQSVSYEVMMIFMIIMILMFFFDYNYSSMFMSNFLFKFFFFFFSFFIWLMIILAESNRTPFDFSEGESELVSGFNTEYSGGLFSLIFISEYGFMLFFCMMSSYLFMGFEFELLFLLMLVFFYIWIRGSIPRFRYDSLMMMVWKVLLPLFFGIFFGFMYESML